MVQWVRSLDEYEPRLHAAPAKFIHSNPHPNVLPYIID